jgi:hypothetical protein
MDIKKDVRLRINALSKEVLGSSSKWQKTMMRGEVFNTDDGRRIMAYPTIEEVEASLLQRAEEKRAAKAGEEARAKALANATVVEPEPQRE